MPGEFGEELVAELGAVVGDNDRRDAVVAEHVLEGGCYNDLAVLSLIGIISGQLVSLSMAVRTYLCPADETMLSDQRSMWTLCQGCSDIIGLRRCSVA